MKLLIADDHALFRDCLKHLLCSEGFEVLGEAADGLEAVELTRHLRPDVVLMDLAMPVMDGITFIKNLRGEAEATRRISQQGSNSKVIMLTASGEDKNFFEAIRAGAVGYLKKDLEAKGLVRHLRGLSKGVPALAPGMARKLMAELARGPGQDQPRDRSYRSLTRREVEVLEAMVRGVTSNKALARHFKLTENTVKFHLQNILEKLHLHNRAQVVSYAVRHRLVRVAESGEA